MIHFYHIFLHFPYAILILKSTYFPKTKKFLGKHFFPNTSQDFPKHFTDFLENFLGKNGLVQGLGGQGMNTEQMQNKACTAPGPKLPVD